MENVTENTSAVANYTATYNAKISNETNSKTLNLAHVYVNGVSFFLRGGANKTIDVYEDEIPWNMDQVGFRVKNATSTSFIFFLYFDEDFFPRFLYTIIIDQLRIWINAV